MNSKLGDNACKCPCLNINCDVDDEDFVWRCALGYLNLGYGLKYALDFQDKGQIYKGKYVNLLSKTVKFRLLVF